MIRLFLATLIGFSSCAALALQADAEGLITQVDASNKTIKVQFSSTSPDFTKSFEICADENRPGYVENVLSDAEKMRKAQVYVKVNYVVGRSCVGDFKANLKDLILKGLIK